MLSEIPPFPPPPPPSSPFLRNLRIPCQQCRAGQGGTAPGEQTGLHVCSARHVFQEEKNRLFYETSFGVILTLFHRKKGIDFDTFLSLTKCAKGMDQQKPV
jgi:hypothetical protein